MSDVKSLFRKKKKAETKGKAEPPKPTVQPSSYDDDEDWGVKTEHDDAFHLGDRKVGELRRDRGTDADLASRVVLEDTREMLQNVRKKAVEGPSTSEPVIQVETKIAEASKPAAEPAPSGPRGWRSGRVNAMRQAVTEGRPLPNADAKPAQKIEDFPELNFSGSGISAGTKPAGVWGRTQPAMDAIVTAKEDRQVAKVTQQQQQPQQQQQLEQESQTPLSHAEPVPQQPPAVHRVTEDRSPAPSDPLEDVSRDVKEKLTVAESLPEVARPAADEQAQSPSHREEASNGPTNFSMPGPVVPVQKTTEAAESASAAEGREEVGKTAKADLKSKFGAKKKKKQVTG